MCKCICVQRKGEGDETGRLGAEMGEGKGGWEVRSGYVGSVSAFISSIYPF